MYDVDHKFQAVVYDDEIYVSARTPVNTRFAPDEFDLIPAGLHMPKQSKSNFRDKWLYRKDIALTLDRQQYSRLAQQKKQIAPLLIQAIADTTLPDYNHFSFGFRGDDGLSVDTISKEWGRAEFVKRLRRMREKKAVPQLQKILYEEDGFVCNETYTHIKHSSALKQESIKTLATFGQKKILLDYLLQQETPSHTLVKAVLLELLQMPLSDKDLIWLEKLAEKYEGEDTQDLFVNQLFMAKTFFEWKNIVDEYAPLQYLILKNIASIGSHRALQMLESIMEHTLYKEMSTLAVCALRFRSRHNQKQIKIGERYLTPEIARGMEHVNKRYMNSDIRYKTDNKISARTHTADVQREKGHRDAAAQQSRETVTRQARDAEYFKTLQPGDPIHINFQYSFDGYEGTVIENDGTELLIESKFSNKKKIGRRRFLIATGMSKGPAYHDSHEDRMIFFHLTVPTVSDPNPDRAPVKIPVYLFKSEQEKNAATTGDDILF